jgi:hypothetical protein
MQAIPRKGILLENYMASVIIILILGILYKARDHHGKRRILILECASYIKSIYEISL